MYVPIWLLVVIALLLAWLAQRAFRRRSGDMLDDQRRASGPALPAADEAAVLADPEVAAALASGRKMDAIRRVRELSGLGLKEAKDLVERRTRTR